VVEVKPKISRITRQKFMSIWDWKWKPWKLTCPRFFSH